MNETQRSNSSSSVQSPLETYLREINETALLTPQDEQDLAVAIGEGDIRARDRMVRANLRLVVNIARGYTGKGLGLQDLIEEGNLGLLRAVEGFDPAMGTRFSTYASYWIKQSIKRALINSAKTIRIPAYMVELLSKWRRASTRLSEELGRSPTPEEVARVLGLPKKKLPIVKKAIKIYNEVLKKDPENAIVKEKLNGLSERATDEATLEKIVDVTIPEAPASDTDSTGSDASDFDASDSDAPIVAEEPPSKIEKKDKPKKAGKGKKKIHLNYIISKHLLFL